MSRELIDTRTSAEEARKRKDFSLASLQAKNGLGYLENGYLRYEEVEAMDETALELTIGLGEIIIDSEKSMAMHAKRARVAKIHIEEALGIMQPLYQMDTFAKVDLVTRAEMSRNVSMVAVAATPLVSREQKKQLLLQGRDNLESMQARLEQGNPLYGLMGIEIAIMEKRLGGKLDRKRIEEGLMQLLASSKDQHRIASAAAWVWDWGGRVGDEELVTIGKKVVEKIITDRPEWERIETDAKARRWKELARDVVLSSLAVFEIPKEERNLLFERLHGINIA